MSGPALFVAAIDADRWVSWAQWEIVAGMAFYC
jgi:hypothetical protein